MIKLVIVCLVVLFHASLQQYTPETAIKLTFGTFVNHVVLPDKGGYYYYDPNTYYTEVRMGELSRNPNQPGDACAFARFRPKYWPTSTRYTQQHNFPQGYTYDQIFNSAARCNWMIYISPVLNATTSGFTTPDNCTVQFGVFSHSPSQIGLNPDVCAIEDQYIGSSASKSCSIWVTSIIIIAVIIMVMLT